MSDTVGSTSPRTSGSGVPDHSHAEETDEGAAARMEEEGDIMTPIKLTDDADEGGTGA